LSCLKDSDKSKVELINKALGSHCCTIQLPENYNGQGIYNGKMVDVDCVTLDSYLQGKPVTFIKMDVEGAEMDVLLGMQQTIKNYKPKLAVCIYHKNPDVFDISEFLLSLVPEYRFHIRHYGIEEREEVLFAQI
jgi:hypothetical protein